MDDSPVKLVLIVTVTIVVILSITLVYSNSKNETIARMVEAGSDPIEAACSLGKYDYDDSTICVINQVKDN